MVEPVKRVVYIVVLTEGRRSVVKKSRIVDQMVWIIICPRRHSKLQCQ